MLDEEAVRKLLAGKTRVTPYMGRYVGNDGPLALVDLGDQRVPIPFATGLVPEVNESVHVWSIDGSMVMLGPSAPKPGMGVVKTVTGDYVTVATDFGDFKMPYGPPSEPPTSGDSVAIIWPGPSCVKLSTSPDPIEPPPNPGGGGSGGGGTGPQTYTVEIRAVDTGSIAKSGGNSWWQARPWNSPSNFGCWFYGTALADTIPDDAQFVSLEIYLVWARRRWDNVLRWGSHTSPWKSGRPAVSGAALWDPGRGAGWYSPPWAQDWFNAAKAGNFGVALNGQTGQEEASSLAEDGQSGALRITYRR